MGIAIIVIFILGYAAIALEHPIKVDKAATALVTGVACWALYVFSLPTDGHGILHIIEHGSEQLAYRSGLVHHLYDIAGILFFLMGAMTIVELVDAHEGFAVITDRIKTTNKVKLLWIICILTFFFSAALDNLTTTIVMISLLRKLVQDKETRWFFVGMVVLSANAGGAWSPIGDVTTTMLWIKGQLPDVPGMIKDLIIPSLITMLVPLSILSFTLKGDVARPVQQRTASSYLNPTTAFERKLIFTMGLLGLLFVPIFKTVTHLPPFMGMMFSLGILWTTTELIHRSKNKEDKHPLSVIGVLQKIDIPSVLFFLGILLAVSAMQEYGHLNDVAMYLDDKLKNIYGINLVIGLLSSIVDNVPLVAAAQGMYSTVDPATLSTMADPEWFSQFVPNGKFWQFLAYCAGTGGSALIIGSAAGVAAMGLEKIDFFWYLRKISLWAVIGYFAGAAYYILLHA